MSTRSAVALVVPTIRKDSFERFVKEWKPHGLFESVDLIIMEDNPKPTFLIDGFQPKHHLSWKDIDEKDWGHIIPRRSDTVRSFAYWFAWNRGYEYIMTLDDDCYPTTDTEDLVGGHLRMLLDRTRWYNTLNTVTPRGIPYFNVGARGIVLNHGLWQGVLDYDAPHQLVAPVPEVFDHSNHIVPHGAYFPMCGMNVMWRAEITVLMYHLLMGSSFVESAASGSADRVLEKFPFDRFGDIWCGILMKKICDHLGLAVSTGTPYIHHDRASSPFTNLRKEANGIEFNEVFWEKIDNVKLTGKNVVECYAELAQAVIAWDGEHSAYWRRLGYSMNVWTKLFNVV